MIKAKITSKTGASLEWELPANIHELHHALTEMGIRKTPRSILLIVPNHVTNIIESEAPATAPSFASKTRQLNRTK